MSDGNAPQPQPRGKKNGNKKPSETDKADADTNDASGETDTTSEGNPPVKNETPSATDSMVNPENGSESALVHTALESALSQGELITPFTEAELPTEDKERNSLLVDAINELKKKELLVTELRSQLNRVLPIADRVASVERRLSQKIADTGSKIYPMAGRTVGNYQLFASTDTLNQSGIIDYSWWDTSECDKNADIYSAEWMAGAKLIPGSCYSARGTLSVTNGGMYRASFD